VRQREAEQPGGEGEREGEAAGGKTLEREDGGLRKRGGLEKF